MSQHTQLHGSLQVINTSLFPGNASDTFVGGRNGRPPNKSTNSIFIDSELQASHDPILALSSWENSGSPLSLSSGRITKRSKDIDYRSVTMEEAMKVVDDNTQPDNLNVCHETHTAVNPGIQDFSAGNTVSFRDVLANGVHRDRPERRLCDLDVDVFDEDMMINDDGPVLEAYHLSVTLVVAMAIPLRAVAMFVLRVKMLLLGMPMGADDLIMVGITEGESQAVEVSKSTENMVNIAPPNATLVSGDFGTRPTPIVHPAPTHSNIRAVGRNPRIPNALKDSIEKPNNVRSFGVVHEVPNSIRSALISSKVRHKVAREKVNCSLMLSKGLVKKGAHLAKYVANRLKGGDPVASIPSTSTAKALDSIQCVGRLSSHFIGSRVPDNSCVADWVSTSCGWDWDRLRHVVSINVLQHIVACPASNSLLGDDVLCWRLTAKRAFTTKSAYVALGDSSTPNSSVWRVLWKARTVWRQVIHESKWEEFMSLNSYDWKVIIETNSADVADLFSGRQEDLRGNTIASTVRQMLNLDWEVKVCKINRVCNRVADSLAKASHGLHVGEIIYHAAPHFVHDLIREGF
ncbi:hypothetical protein V6N11_054885 [Hibiscus sabdariffa]|uniref:RNase H type-1 domain-containing protein n=1 Tax=Hibiscus sabdariffa TaxID=183260 RepID=A0ABR2P374_9ROSI